MSNFALFHQDTSYSDDQAGTHVLVIGVGHYSYGKGTPHANAVAGDLRQLSSPPISAKAIAEWFVDSYNHPDKPLATVSLLISDTPTGAVTQAPRATLANVKAAAAEWVKRLNGNKNSMAVFYFCGHGLSQGDNAALLLEDFGKPDGEYDGAINLTTLCGTMKNVSAIEQAFFVDCCRTSADDLYRHESDIGSRIASVPWNAGKHNMPAQQFVLFPTIDGEEAFGIQGQVSIFTRSIIDALSFAAANCSSGFWRTTTADLLGTVDKLVALRLPDHYLGRSKPNAVNASSFEFNELKEPTLARSFVTLSDRTLWGEVEFECSDPDGGRASQQQHSKDLAAERCCKFDLEEGSWRFSGIHTPGARIISPEQRTVRLPVSYVNLKVQP